MVNGFTPAPQDPTGMGPFGPMSVPGGVPPTAGPVAGEEGLGPITVQDMYEDQMSRARTPEEIAAAYQLRDGFYAWAIAKGVAADPNDPEQSRAYLNEILGLDEPTGGVGRVQFPSEAEVDFATAELRRQQAQTQAYERRMLEQQARTEAFRREELRERAASEAFNRAKAKFDLLTVTDQLADARREAATDALVAALPYMVSPGQQYTPGFEPFGAGQQLGQMLGANVPIQQMPTAELPLSELANPPLAAPPAAIEAGLDPFLTAPGTPQI